MSDQPVHAPGAVPQPVHAEFAATLELMPDLSLTHETVVHVRELLAAMVPSTPSDKLTRTDHVVDEAHGIVVRVHDPGASGAPRPCVYSIHGGGYVLGNRFMDDDRLAPWCLALGCVGASVEYRLAPEHPYPAALDDCYAGLRWVHEHADELGIDPQRTGIAGLSAGGGLAAALALCARDRGELPVAFQLLDSPMIDDRQHTPSSRSDGLPVWSRESNTFGWRSYLGDLYGRDDVPAHAAAARATDLSGLPPAFVCVGTVDGFRDENVEYATRLNQAGVPTELHVYPGAPHGFGVFSQTAVARQANQDIERWLGARFSAA